jgi:hypothetical protein
VVFLVFAAAVGADVWEHVGVDAFGAREGRWERGVEGGVDDGLREELLTIP